jgi:hydrogenase large subunit
MSTTVRIDPVTRIEGHLAIEVTVDTVGGTPQVVDAKSSATAFRGFEAILANRDPRDAVYYTQRICGVCPTSHALAAAMVLDQAFGAVPPANGRILRNLILGADHLQSHVLHFYHLAILDYIDTTGIPGMDMSPWTPHYATPDMVTGPTAQTLKDHYMTALAIRRKAHQMGAIFGGKLPCTSAIVCGGVTEAVTTEKIAAFRALLTEIRAFVDNVYVPDANALAALFPQYSTLGAGCGNLLSYGAFDLDAGGSSRLFARGRYTAGAYGTVDPAQIKEYVLYSWYTAASGNKNPSVGVTEPLLTKPGAYTWDKAPRYSNQAHEVGPLARMWINGDYRVGISAMDRIVARALETQKLADAMDGWLDELTPGASGYAERPIPVSGSAVGLTEAPRGALGHWLSITNSKISRYQVVTPTSWNCSPKDDTGLKGPVEQALLGVPVADTSQPVEVLRVVHSLDPCLACTVHLLRPGRANLRPLGTTSAGNT